jgi:hypothetical protein
MSTEIKVSHEVDVLMVSAFNSPTSYLFWQCDTDEVSEVFFEYNDESNGGFNNITECLVNEVGIQISTKSSEKIDFQFSKLTSKGQARLLAGLKDIFAQDLSVLTIEV